MSGTVSAAMLLSSTGLVKGFLVRWFGSWAVGFAIALHVGIVVGPLADRLRRRIQGSRDASSLE